MSIEVTSDWANRPSLEEAWRRVRRNNGRAGADGVSISDFQMRLAINLKVLENELISGTYQPARNFTIRKNKPDGTARWIRIPSVRDRVAQTACANEFCRIFDPKMGETSFAFRPNKSVEHAAGRIAKMRLQGWRYGIRTDIQRFFDEIPIRVLLDQIGAALPCKGTEAVIRLWFRGFAHYGRGIGQGSPLSPVLANIYLIPFDRSLNQGRLRIIRYSDDILALCKRTQDIDLARHRITQNLRELGLRANTGKTAAVCFETGFNFLGLTFRQDRIFRPNPDIEPKMLWV